MRTLVELRAEFKEILAISPDSEDKAMKLDALYDKVDHSVAAERYSRALSRNTLGREPFNDALLLGSLVDLRDQIHTAVCQLEHLICPVAVLRPGFHILASGTTQTGPDAETGSRA